MNNLLEIQRKTKSQIYILRDKEVMIDVDVAEMYEVSETRDLNRKVKENPKKFDSETYTFELTVGERKKLFQQDTILAEKLRFNTSIRVYSEYGILMLSTTFQKNNDIATDICKAMVEGFVEYRKQKKQDNSVLLELKRDIEILKQLAIEQNLKNEEYESSLAQILGTIVKNEQSAETRKIGF